MYFMTYYENAVYDINFDDFTLSYDEVVLQGDDQVNMLLFYNLPRNAMS